MRPRNRMHGTLCNARVGHANCFCIQAHMVQRSLCNGRGVCCLDTFMLASKPHLLQRGGSSLTAAVRAARPDRTPRRRKSVFFLGAPVMMWEGWLHSSLGNCHLRASRVVCANCVFCVAEIRFRSQLMTLWSRKAAAGNLKNLLRNKNQNLEKAPKISKSGKLNN